jgi:virginiamycin B lyase
VSYKKKCCLDRPTDIAPGPDGNLWFVNSKDGYGSPIANINPTTWKVTDFSGTGTSYVDSITPASDGAMWFTEWGDNAVGRITTSATPAITSMAPLSGRMGRTVTPSR